METQVVRHAISIWVPSVDPAGDDDNLGHTIYQSQHEFTFFTYVIFIETLINVAYNSVSLQWSHWMAVPEWSTIASTIL